MRIGDIKSHVFAQLNAIEIGFVKSGYREGIFHATDYSATCARKQYYDKLKMHANLTTNFGSVAPLFVGLAVHQALEKGYGKKEMAEVKMAFDLTTGDSVNFMDLAEMKQEDQANVIVGTLDAIYDIGGEKVIVDYKTWHSKGYQKRSVDPVHEFQVNVYGVMLSACKNIEAKYGAVVYLDSSERFLKPKVFVFKLDAREKILESITERHGQFLNAMQAGKLPDRTITDWLCESYCPYASRCFTEEKISKEENQIG